MANGHAMFTEKVSITGNDSQLEWFFFDCSCEAYTVFSLLAAFVIINEDTERLFQKRVNYFGLSGLILETKDCSQEAKLQHQQLVGLDLSTTNASWIWLNSSKYPREIVQQIEAWRSLLLDNYDTFTILST